MLSKLRVQHYKSLFDTEVDLEPLTVFIGPNGSGKSNICEALAVLSIFLKNLVFNIDAKKVINLFTLSLQSVTNSKASLESKFWQGKLDIILFEVTTLPSLIETNTLSKISTSINYRNQQASIDLPRHLIHNSNKISITDDSVSNLRQFLIESKYFDSLVENDLRGVSIYDFSPISLVNNTPADFMERSGQGIAYALVDILHSNREGFDELEERFRQLVPNIKKILLPRGSVRDARNLSLSPRDFEARQNTFSLELIDKYSEHHIPASDISDGTLRILAFLTALYQENTPSIICFEELENGVHPWLLSKMMELLKIVSTEGITGKPVQVLITTHSPLLLNYVEPHQVRAVELDEEGKTQVHALPTDSVRFQKALEAYDGSLGELWFTNIFGGNPQ
ncbi:MAG: ATP-binding protein [Coleofasciculaceae cyanobacterium SM2_1_6]|nr:ATP-binding protein [Coleofasciculaceae cyanobacterium SM2_1_6]